jgi:CRISPR/Cas system CSM-associated protein Csm3 (group 7 of RAMP superfamily)
VCQQFSSALFLTALQKKRHGYFMQDDAKTHNVIYSINDLNTMSEDRLCRLWATSSPDFNPCDCYMGKPKKEKVYSNNPYWIKTTAFVKQLHLSRSVKSS